MARKIRFPLRMADGAEVKDLEQLREHFDLQTVVEHYKSGKLLNWLEARYLEGEAEAVRELDDTTADFQKQLCEALQVEYTGDEVDLEAIALRQERLKRLRAVTDEAEYIENIDRVAFDQEDLADLLDENESTIYLCGEKFTVPASRKGITYVGINEPAVHISGRIPKTAEELGIVFTGITCDNLPEVTVARTASRARAQSQPKTFGRSQTLRGSAAEASVIRAPGLDGSVHLPTYTEEQYEMLLNAELYRLNPDVIPSRQDFGSAVVPERTADGSCWTVIEACEPGMYWVLLNQNGVEVTLNFGGVMTGEKILRRALMMAATAKEDE